MYSHGTQGDYIALQLKDNKLVLNIDLGSGIMTSFSVGSLLDDNIWHDTVISRNRRDIIFSVDRVIIRGRLKGEFDRLNLNHHLYLGGVPSHNLYQQEGLVVFQNFTGCFENLFLNHTNFIRDMKYAYEVEDSYKYSKINTIYACPSAPIYPVTFLTKYAHAKLKGYEAQKTMNVSLYFRTFEDRGIILYHEFASGGYVKVFLEFGKVKVDLKLSSTNRHILDNYDQQFNDGKWHSLVFTMSLNQMILNIDERPMVTSKKIKISTGRSYFIAGGFDKSSGFVGCMRSITVDGNYLLPKDWKLNEEYFGQGEIVVDACQMIDRCNPNPCKHNGNCHQNSLEYFCDCSQTGYAGAVCHTSKYPLSCQAYKNVQHVQQKVNIQIDVDGSGPLKPFPVTCEYLSKSFLINILLDCYSVLL